MERFVIRAKPQIQLVQMQVYRRMSSVLPTNLADTATTSQDDSSLKFITPIAGRNTIFRMQVAESSGRCRREIKPTLQVVVGTRPFQ